MALPTSGRQLETNILRGLPFNHISQSRHIHCWPSCHCVVPIKYVQYRYINHTTCWSFLVAISRAAGRPVNPAALVYTQAHSHSHGLYPTPNISRPLLFVSQLSVDMGLPWQLRDALTKYPLVTQADGYSCKSVQTHSTFSFTFKL